MLESLRVSMSQSSISIIHPVLPFLGLVLSLSLVICRCMAPSLIGDFVHVVRQALRSLAFQPNASDPVPVSLAHPQPGDWSQATHGGGRRRVIHGIHEQSYEEYQYSRTRKRSFQPNIEMLLNVPYWKRRSLGSLEIRHKVPAPVTKVIRDNTTGQVGDALKGLAPDDLVLPKTITQSARRLLQKMAIFRDSDSDEDIEPPLTALLADSEPEQTTKRNVTITSGLVALGLVQAGSTLASSVGGHIGPEILVKVETSDKMEKLGAMPSPSHCVLATGVDQ